VLQVLINVVLSVGIYITFQVTVFYKALKASNTTGTQVSSYLSPKQ